MSYGHAAYVTLASGEFSPLPGLEVANRKLLAWAQANPQAPALHELYLDYKAIERRLGQYLAANDPVKTPTRPELATMLAPGRDYPLMRCAAEVRPRCQQQFQDSGRWARIRAQREGWFFPRTDQSKAFCPEHNPPWVAAWRARTKRA